MPRDCNSVRSISQSTKCHVLVRVFEPVRFDRRFKVGDERRSPYRELIARFPDAVAPDRVLQ